MTAGAVEPSVRVQGICCPHEAERWHRFDPGARELEDTPAEMQRSGVRWCLACTVLEVLGTKARTASGVRADIGISTRETRAALRDLVALGLARTDGWTDNTDPPRRKYRRTS